MADKEIALVVGVGGGLGAALGRRFAKEGMSVALAARGNEVTDPLATMIEGAGGTARAYSLDATDEAAVVGLFQQVHDEFGKPDLVVYNAG
ncbi:MAG: SDR family NAD(P)-dependent oxidoreductase, partial [Alphaproteobacteria bacterium]